MNNKHLFLIFCLLFSLPSFAQQKEKMTREDKQEKNEARTARINSKNDYAIFHRQLLSLKEYMDERKKIPNLQKANKMPVKVVVAIDTVDEGDEASAKKLTGYIRQDIGDNSVNVYDVTFDRSVKKIVSVKRTPEALEADKEEAEAKAEKTTTIKTKEKTIIHKKNKDEDDDDADEEKPTKNKKNKDDDD